MQTLDIKFEESETVFGRIFQEKLTTNNYQADQRKNQIKLLEMKNGTTKI